MWLLTFLFPKPRALICSHEAPAPLGLSFPCGLHDTAEKSFCNYFDGYCSCDMIGDHSIQFSFSLKKLIKIIIVDVWTKQTCFFLHQYFVIILIFSHTLDIFCDLDFSLGLIMILVIFFYKLCSPYFPPEFWAWLQGFDPIYPQEHQWGPTLTLDVQVWLTVVVLVRPKGVRWGWGQGQHSDGSDFVHTDSLPNCCYRVGRAPLGPQTKDSCMYAWNV